MPPFFASRRPQDHPPYVIPQAFNDPKLTTEYSMRTGMESVYTLLNVDRGVPEVWGSKYDVRELLRACYYAIDKKPLSEAELNFGERELMKIVLKKIRGTDVELLLKESGLIE